MSFSVGPNEVVVRTDRQTEGPKPQTKRPGGHMAQTDIKYTPPRPFPFAAKRKCICKCKCNANAFHTGAHKNQSTHT